MDITHCGICGSDIHTLDCGWVPIEYDVVVGHEITGVAIRVGKNVKHIKVGDRIGVGAQCGACLECYHCRNGDENICLNGVIGTYIGRWPNVEKTFGGYADKWRGHQRFVFKIPDNMSNEVAATFLCAGITTYAPVKRYNVKPGDKVGVIGIGGLGHFAVMWAKAMGATVVALSSTDRKREDAKALGCDDYVVIGDEEAMKKHAISFTHIICTSFSKDFNWDAYFSMMLHNSTFILAGLPEEPLKVGSIIGSPKMIEEMLQFASETSVRPWLNKFPMKECPQAVQHMREGKARYRIILETRTSSLPPNGP
ncbi:hypothetical protein VTP01DRAFT_9985 [Rhizomucor pusillus]|uniref:uncharacterized protein n=1 Tax=Rhizomucor pusillus TaxID=4840 RepID=UPI0037449116